MEYEWKKGNYYETQKMGAVNDPLVVFQAHRPASVMKQDLDLQLIIRLAIKPTLSVFHDCGDV